MKLQHEPALDGLRAIAAVAVVLFHAHVPGVHGGAHGVEVFFVLSSWLITSILLRQERIDLRTFWARRLRRLLPALIVMVAVVSAAAPLYPPEFAPRWRDALLALSYTMNLPYASGAVPAGVFSHTWTLAWEMQFYLVWPLVLPWLLRLRDPRAVLVAAWLALLGLRYALTLHFGPVTPPLMFTRMSGLLVGAWLAIGGRLPARYGLLGLFMIAIGFVANEAMFLGGPFAEFGAALLIADVTSRASPLKTALSVRPLVGLGAISYGVYLWHAPLEWLIHGEPWWIKAPVLLTASSALAALSYHLVERRFLLPTLRQQFEAA